MADLTHLTHLLPALDRLIEATSPESKDHQVRPLENRLRRGLATMWSEQRRMVLERLPEFRHRFQEALSDDELSRLWFAVTLATEGPMAEVLDDLAPTAMRRGHQAAAAEVPASARAGISFDLQHPRAVEFLRNRGAERVTMIDSTTRDRLRTVLTQAGDEGWAYSRTVRQIRDTFTGFGGRSPLRHIRDRAELVVVQEMALAYGEGQRVAREQIMADGTQLEKNWLTAGDSRVDADCAANGAAGWIPANDSFPTGHGQEPAHPGCRCSTRSRVAEESRVPTPAAA